MTRKRYLSAGFTLVEILVVLAIVAILATIFVAVFGRVRENARRVSCVSNMKQLGLAWQMYADDSDGRVMPFSVDYGTTTRFWNGLAAGEDEEAVSNRGLLQPWLKSKTFRCPSVPVDEFVTEEKEAVHGYGYNNLAFPSVLNNSSRSLPLLSSIEKPTELAVFADTASIVPAGMINPKEPAHTTIAFALVATSAHTPCFQGRHNGWGNVLWADGHVEAMRPLFLEGARRVRHPLPVELQQQFAIGFLDRDGKFETNEFFELNPDVK